MYGIFTYIWPKFMVNLGKYSSPMDGIRVKMILDNTSPIETFQRKLMKHFSPKFLRNPVPLILGSTKLTGEHISCPSTLPLGSFYHHGFSVSNISSCSLVVV